MRRMSDYHRRIYGTECTRRFRKRHRPDWPNWLFISDRPHAKPACKCGARWDTARREWYTVRDLLPGETERLQRQHDEIAKRLKHRRGELSARVEDTGHHARGRERLMFKCDYPGCDAEYTSALSASICADDDAQQDANTRGRYARYKGAEKP